MKTVGIFTVKNDVVPMNFFGHGAVLQGYSPTYLDPYKFDMSDVEPFDVVAVGAGPTRHRHQNEKIIYSYRHIGVPVVIIELVYLLDGGHCLVSLNEKGNYPQAWAVDSQRRIELGFNYEPIPRGDVVLIAGQRPQLDRALEDAVMDIRCASDRHVHYRKHPNAKRLQPGVSYSMPWANSESDERSIESAQPSLKDDLDSAWVVLTHSSNVGNAALLRGIPVIAHKAAAFYEHAVPLFRAETVDKIQPDFKEDIERYFDRLACAVWSFEEIRLGRAFSYLKWLWEQPRQLTTVSVAPRKEKQRIGALTCTGGRPEAFSFCTKYMESQTEQDFEWVVVDDVGDVTSPSRCDCLINPEPPWTPAGGHTLARNMIAGLEKMKDFDIIVFIEDDDWYHPNYIKTVVERFNSLPSSVEIIGECQARYYNVRSRVWLKANNTSHASLCSTAIRGSFVERMIEHISKTQSPFIDLSVWKEYRELGHLFPPGLSYGIKGLPGRGGIGCGHRLGGNRSARFDPDMTRLKNWIGDDAELYAGYHEPTPQPPPQRETPPRHRRRMLQGKALEIENARRRRR